MMDGIFAIIFITLLVYWLTWHIYLLLAPAVLGNFEFWDDLPGFVKKPKFWQFVLAVFALGTIRKKLDI